MTEIHSEQDPERAPIPAGVKMPADRQKPAAQLEAEGIETIDVQWRDFTFSVPAAADDWEAETSIAFEEGKAVSGVRSVLGKKQWAELSKTTPRNRDINDLFTVIAEAMGLDISGN